MAFDEIDHFARLSDLFVMKLLPGSGACIYARCGRFRLTHSAPILLAALTLTKPSGIRSAAILAFAVLSVAVLSVAGCNGGGGAASPSGTGGQTGTGAPGGGTGPVTACTPSTLTPGSSLTLASNTQVLVPAGTTVTTPNSNIINVSGNDDTIYATAGSVVAVPSTATGTANDLVSTGEPTGCGPTPLTATVMALAGSATSLGPPVDGTGSAAIFWGGGHLAITAQSNILVSDRGLLRQVTQGGVVTTLSQGNFSGIAIGANGAVFGSAQGTASGANWTGSIIEFVSGLVQPFVSNWEISTNPSVGMGGLAADSAGNLYYADGVFNRIVKFTASGAASVLAGSGVSGTTDGMGTAATLNNPTDLAIDSLGNLFFVDLTNNLVRKIAVDGNVTTIADLGRGVLFGSGAIAVDPSENVYVAGAGAIYRLTPSGSIESIAVPTSVDFITALTSDFEGNIYLGTRGVGAQIIKVSF